MVVVIAGISEFQVQPANTNEQCTQVLLIMCGVRVELAIMLEPIT